MDEVENVRRWLRVSAHPLEAEPFSAEIRRLTRQAVGRAERALNHVDRREHRQRKKDSLTS
jgi:hypothetical protein